MVTRVAETSAWPVIIQHSRTGSSSDLSVALEPWGSNPKHHGGLGMSGVSMAGLGMEEVDAMGRQLFFF